MERPESSEIPTRIAVRAILLNSQGQVLLTKRTSETYEGDKWCLVGGKPNEGEALEKAIVRETEEEIGISFVPSAYFGEIEDPDISSGARWITHYFIGRIEVLPENLQERESSEARFFSPAELQTIEIAFIHREVLEKYFETF